MNYRCDLKMNIDFDTVQRYTRFKMMFHARTIEYAITYFLIYLRTKPF